MAHNRLSPLLLLSKIDIELSGSLTERMNVLKALACNAAPLLRLSRWMVEAIFFELRLKGYLLGP